LRPRAGADRVDHAARGQADHAADEGCRHHHHEAQRPADRAQHAGRRVAHGRAGSSAAERAHDLAAVVRCRFFRLSVVGTRRSAARNEQRASDEREFFHFSISNGFFSEALTR
jgi:hypothetical protein